MGAVYDCGFGGGVSEQDQGVAFGTGCQPTAQWRPIVGYEGLYEVSIIGNVRSLRTGKFRALVHDTFGYLTLRLTSAEGEKRHSVHRLVCRAFHGEAPVGFHAAHLDGDPTNNHALNLTWASPKENNAHKRQHGTAQTGAKHPRARLSQEQVEQIQTRAAAGEALRSIAADLGVHETHVGKIVAGKRWSIK